VREKPFQPHFQGSNGAHVSGVFTILGDSYNPETRTWNLSGEHILRQQDFWFVTGMTTLYVELGISLSIAGMLTRFV
jgi:hypothetical protein